MKKICLSILLLSSCLITYSQTFEKIIAAPNEDFIYDFSLTNNDDIALFIINRDVFNFANFQPVNTQLVLLSKNGSIKRQRELTSQDFLPTLDSTYNSLLLNSSIFEDPNFLINASIRIDTPSTFAEVFFILDTNLNILNYKVQDTTINEIHSYDRMKRIGNTIHTSGYHFDYNFRLIQGAISTLGASSLQNNSKMLFNTPDSLYLTRILDFLVDKQKNTYLFSEGNYDTSWVSDLQFVKMDSNGQVLQRAFFTHPLLSHDAHLLNFGISLNAFWKTDSTFIISANGKTEWNRKGDIHLFEYNTDFVQLNYHRIVTLDSSEFNFNPKTGTYDSLSNCYYMGVTKRFGPWSRGPWSTGDTSDFQLIKFDKNLNIKFNRYYRRNRSLVFMMLRTDSEGNVIMVGQTQEINFIDPTNTDIFILKVDSLGNINHPVGIEESSSEIDPINFQFYPNPSSGLVNFRQYNVVENYEMELYNSPGQLIQRYTLRHSDNSIDLSNFPSGIYIYQLTDSQGRRASGKLVRE